MKKVWIPLVQLSAVTITLLVFWGFADELALNDRLRTVYLAAIIGIAIVGMVRVLIRINPGDFTGPAQTPNSKTPNPKTPNPDPNQREDWRE